MSVTDRGGGYYMSNSTLEEMNAIELEAIEIKKSYQAKINEASNSIETKLKEAANQLDIETQELIRVAREQYEQKEKEYQAQLAEKVQTNQQKLTAALGDKKAALIDQIVEKVVEQYGN